MVPIAGAQRGLYDAYSVDFEANLRRSDVARLARHIE
jgi:hypothetical protein